MPRQPRINTPGLLHHIMARGVEKRPIFLSTRDYQDFLSRLARLLPECEVKCYAWSLMTNHLHLLLRSGQRGISNLMHRLLGGYAIAFNLRRKRVGHLFQNRFKSIVCEDQTYFTELIRYIHLNPVRANLVQTPGELGGFPWTSHPALMGDVNLNWMASDEVLSYWDEDVQIARNKYETFLRDGWDQGVREDLEGGGLIRSSGSIPQGLGDLRILGGGDFVTQVLADSEIVSARPSKSSIEDVLLQVCELMQVSPQEILSGSRSKRISQAKSLFIQQGIVKAGMTLRAMADMTKMSPGAACRAQKRTRHWVTA